MAARCVALIPARSGSTRVPGKNVRVIGGHPLVAYTIAAARRSDIFGDVVVSTDSAEIAAVARSYGASVPFLRPPGYATSTSPDIEWVRHALEQLPAFDAFSILRPTNPFRTPSTIRRAWSLFQSGGVDSLRAVEVVRQHPGKMWRVEDGILSPLLPQPEGEVPWHSRQFQDLPEVYVQNGSLEIAWTSIVRDSGTIAGERILAFLTEGLEGFDINRPEDWREAEWLVAKGEAALENPTATGTAA
jgi:CMP-N,N'-diacetyllegionaminic acid synthase